MEQGSITVSSDEDKAPKDTSAHAPTVRPTASPPTHDDASPDLPLGQPSFVVVNRKKAASPPAPPATTTAEPEVTTVQEVTPATEVPPPPLAPSTPARSPSPAAPVAVDSTPVASPPQPWKVDDTHPSAVALPEIADMADEGDSGSEAEGGGGTTAAASGTKKAGKKAGGGKKKKTGTGVKKTAAAGVKEGKDGVKPKKKEAAPVVDKAALLSLAGQVGSAKDIKALARELRKR